MKRTGRLPYVMVGYHVDFLIGDFEGLEHEHSVLCCLCRDQDQFAGGRI